MIKGEKNRAIIDEMKKVVPQKFRKSATSKKDIELKFHGDGTFHWVGKRENVKPQLNL